MKSNLILVGLVALLLGAGGEAPQFNRQVLLNRQSSKIVLFSDKTQINKMVRR